MRIVVICTTLLMLGSLAWVNFTHAQTLSFGTSNKTLVATPVADVLVSSGQPENRYSDSEFISVGYEVAQNLEVLRTLLKFDLATIPSNSEIMSATLSLELAGATGTDAEMDIFVQRIDSESWTEDINWKEYEDTEITEYPGIASVIVNKDLGVHTWIVTEQLLGWIENRPDSSHIGFIMTGNELPEQHQRAFWSKECNENSCSHFPTLEIHYRLVADPLPAPTPGIALFSLRNDPCYEIQPGQSLTYTVRYQKTITNTTPLENIRITNTIPINVEYIDVIDKSADINCPSKESVTNKQFTCTSSRLADNNPRFITYQVQRPAPEPTPTPEFIEIIKTGPLTATANVPFTYTFWVTSHTDMTLTNIVITDIIPSGVTPINIVVDPHRIATFALTETLEAGATISKTFQVLAEQTVTNSNYRVKAIMNQQEDATVSARGYNAVTTYIGELPPTFVVFNQGAEISWIYLDESNSVKKQSKTSNGTLNFKPVELIYLPVMRR
ncbi:MAG: DNRLRE domain-containing protein [Caldilineaceae bacterium]